MLVFSVMLVLRRVRGKPWHGDQEDQHETNHEDPELERRVPSQSDALEALL
jgi:hypothetical protein